MAPRFRPTDEQRRLVRTLAGFGVTQPDIAAHLGIDDTTLRRHCREELDRGVVEANAKVAQSLFRMATEQNNVAAAIFWMKSRGRWRERWPDEVHEEPLQIEIVRFSGPPKVVGPTDTAPASPTPPVSSSAPDNLPPREPDRRGRCLSEIVTCSTPTNDR